MKYLLKKYMDSWKFTIEFSKRAGGGYNAFDWFKGVSLLTLHTLCVGVCWIYGIQMIAGG